MASPDYKPSNYALEEYSESLTHKREGSLYQSPDLRAKQLTADLQKTSSTEYQSPKHPLVAKASPSVTSTFDIQLVSSQVENLLKSAEDALKRSQSSKLDDAKGSRGFEHSKLFSLAVSAEPSSAITVSPAKQTAQKVDELLSAGSHFNVNLNLNNQFISVADPLPHIDDFKINEDILKKINLEVPNSRDSKQIPSVTEFKETYISNEVHTYQIPALNTNFELFPIRENPKASYSARSSGVHSKSVSHNDRGMKDVHDLKSGISSLEEKLNAFTSFGREPSPNPAPFTSKNRYNNSIRDDLNFSHADVNNFSLIAPAKVREFSLSGPDFLRRSSFLDREFSTSFTPKNYNTHPNIFNSAGPGATSEDLSQRVIRNIDDIMQRHLFNSTAPSRTSRSRDRNQYTSPNKVPLTYTKSLYTSPITSKFQDEFSHGYASSYKKNPLGGSNNDFAYQSTYKYETYGHGHDRVSHKESVFMTPPDSHNNSPKASVHEFKAEFGSSKDNRKANKKEFGSDMDLDRQCSNENQCPTDMMSSADRRMKKLTLKAKQDNERRDALGSTPIKKEHQTGDLFSDNEVSAHFDFNVDADNGRLPEFRAGDLVSDDDVHHHGDHHHHHHPHHETRQSVSNKTRQSISNNTRIDTYKSGDVSSDCEEALQQHIKVSPVHAQDKKAQVNLFNSGDVLSDTEAADLRAINKKSQAKKFKAGDLLDCGNEREETVKTTKPPRNPKQIRNSQALSASFRAGDLLSDCDMPDMRGVFRSSDLMSDIEDAKRINNNRKDDGKGWHMVHNVGSSIFESQDNSFDFSNAPKSRENIEHEHTSKVSKKNSKAHIWVMKSPLESRVSNMSSSSKMSESVRKAQRSPIITHLFDKFEKAAL